MKRIAILALCAAPIVAWCEDLTNTVVTVDQRGNLNVEGIASVEDVATNAVKVQIAEAKAAAAQATAQGVTAALQATVENIMSNNVIIYRSGFSDSFAALVIITENDTFAIVEARWIEKSAAQIVVDIDYVSTADLGLTKPAVYWHDTLTNKTDFTELAASNVSTPAPHSESREYGGQTFAGYYTIRVTIPNPSSYNSCFIWLDADGDIPSGDGATLDLPNGVTGGVTGTYTWGDKVLDFRGGVLRGVRDAD